MAKKEVKDIEVIAEGVTRKEKNPRLPFQGADSVPLEEEKE